MLNAPSLWDADWRSHASVWEYAASCVRGDKETITLVAKATPCRLNSREFNVTRGIEVIDGMDVGMNIIARANRLAAQEQWNVPQVRCDSLRGIGVPLAADYHGMCLNPDRYRSLHLQQSISRSRRRWGVTATSNWRRV